MRELNETRQTAVPPMNYYWSKASVKPIKASEYLCVLENCGKLSYQVCSFSEGRQTGSDLQWYLPQFCKLVAWQLIDEYLGFCECGLEIRTGYVYCPECGEHLIDKD